VQIVHSSRRGSRDIEHIGSARDDVGLEVLKAAARQRLAAARASSIWAWSAPSLRGGVLAARCRSRRRGGLLPDRHAPPACLCEGQQLSAACAAQKRRL